jgi:hypothetical protein
MGVTEFAEKEVIGMATNNMYSYATSSGLAGISGMSGTSGVGYNETEKGGKGMMQSVKGYFHTYRDWILTFLFVVIVDHFIFDGVLREKIKMYFDKAKDKMYKLKTVKES